MNLNSNKLKSLTDKNQTLTSLESLELMDLSCNQLALVNLNILKDLTQLKTLILRNNCIENLDKSVFQGCINFTKLELSDNKLNEIDFEVFSILT